MGENGLTASDIALLSDKGGCGGWGEMSFMWIFALLILANGGFGFGNNGFANAIGYENLATSNEVEKPNEAALIAPEIIDLLTMDESSFFSFPVLAKISVSSAAMFPMAPPEKAIRPPTTTANVPPVATAASAISTAAPEIDPVISPCTAPAANPSPLIKDVSPPTKAPVMPPTSHPANLPCVSALLTGLFPQ